MKENFATFQKRLEKFYQDDLLDIELAYTVSKYSHRHDVRKEIDPESQKNVRYFEHPRRVSLILIDEVWALDPSVIISALLHDAIEDTTAVNYDRVRRWFGREIARIVQLLTKTPENKEDYVDILMASADWRALMIKAADRLDNLRSLENTSNEFKARQIKETKEKYFPLFDRLIEIAPTEHVRGARYLRTEIGDQVGRIEKTLS